MSLLDFKLMLNEDLTKRLTEHMNVEDWTDSCNKCEYPKLIHKNLHRDATCTEKQETPEALIKYWDEYKKRIKPVLKTLKEEIKKDLQEGILLKSLKDLTEANTKAIDTNKSKLLTMFK